MENSRRCQVATQAEGLTPSGSTLVGLRHRTRYAYGGPIRLGPQVIRLRPAPHCATPILSYRLTVLPAGHDLRQYQDPSGNFLARVSFPDPADALELTVDLVADLAERNPFDFMVDPEAAGWPFRYDALLAHELSPYCSSGRPAWMTELLAGLDQGSSVDMLVSLNHLVHDRVFYLQRMETGVQTPEQTLLLASGSCRDSAWLLVHTARALGFAARFVSGYLIQLFEPTNPAGNLHEDGADLHAWAEMYLPGAGWIGFDATSGLVIGPGHIPLACTADPATAAPISGTLSAAAAVDFTASLSVVRLHGPEAKAVPDGKSGRESSPRYS